MKKEMIIVSIILIATIIVNFITQKYTSDSVDKINSTLSEILKIAEEGDSNKLEGKFDDLDTKWKKANNNLAYYVEHDELEKVDTSIVALKSYLREREYKEGITETRKCIFILEHIKDKGKLTVFILIYNKIKRVTIWSNSLLITI